MWNAADAAVWEAVAAAQAAHAGAQPNALTLIDDAGEAPTAVRQARDLIATGALALACCSTPEATVAVAFVLEREAPLLPLLALHPLPPSAHRAHFTLSLDDAVVFKAIAVDATTQAKASLALLSVDNAWGASALAAFEEALARAQRGFAGEARYAPGTAVMTPEALWVATRDAGAIVHWGEDGELARAVDALRRRGFEGLVYARPTTLSSEERNRLILAGPHLFDPRDLSLGLRSVATPIEVAHLLPAGHAHRAALDALADAVGAPRWGALSAQERFRVALLDDAAIFLRRALEVVGALGVDEEASTLRSALRDALVTLAPLPLSSGTFDASDSGPAVLSWRGLIPVMVGPAAP